MEIQRFFFKLLFSLLLLLAVYFETSLEQQPNNCSNGKRDCNIPSIAAAPGVSFVAAPDVSIAPAPRDVPHGPVLPPEEVDVVRALLELIEDTPKGYFSESSCDSEAYSDFITCDCTLNSNTTCRVTELDLSHQGIEGLIPEEIGSLSNLMTLDLSYNMLSGTIPGSFANLSNLTSLSLNNNLLEGPIPSVLLKMESLEVIDLSVNFFNGTIPSQLDTLSGLEYLDLDNNLLLGEIPKELGNISTLQSLYLFDNMLRGQLPDELGKLSNLNYLSLSNNELSGPLPSSFGKLKSLMTFNVRGNSLLGKIPGIVFSWPQLQYLSLIGNNFEAPLPKDKFWALKNIYKLHVTDLISYQPYSESEFPDVSKLTSLRYLTLRNCSLAGPIHSSVWELPNLIYLDLSFNKLSGEVPANIDKSSLIYLYLRSNEFNESLPKWLKDERIGHVDVSENKFKQISIPPGNISHNTNLFACCSGSNISDEHEKWIYGAHYCPDETFRDDNLYINCGGNSTIINGSNYEADLQQEGGSTFFLSDSKRWGYSSLGTFLIANDDLYILSKTCNLTMADAPLYQTARVAPISLKYYGFCFKKNKYIVRLHFAEIAWDANQVSGFKNRRTFDVKIQDKIKLSNFNIEAAAGGAEMNITKEFIVDVNDTLEIHLYWSGEGSISWPTPYYGPLISAISVSPVPKRHKKLSTAAIAGIGASAALCVVLTLVLFRLLGWFGGKKLQDEELKAIELYPGGYFNFRDIKAATQNFDASSKLGEGGFGAVYKGVLPNGTEIAVKQLSARSRQGIHEFVNEIGTVSALQHPNLVRLMGCCAVDNQLLLIYEYMENNSLAHALFGHEEKKLRPDWTRRIKICLGIAKGLAFLHEESKLKIIHRDIKATNILLDKDLNAKISDFGFAKLFEEEDTHVITRIAGTLGYMAPEYAMRGHLTTKADVYSFGVVTLEIVSGKSNAICRPNDRTVFLLDLAYVSKEQGNLLALVDPNLGSEYSLKEATTLLELAILCTNQSPTLRPIMSEVVDILEGKSKIKTALTSGPHSIDNFTMAKAVAALTQSPESRSNLEGGPSGFTVSRSISKEIEESSFSAYHSAKTVM